LTCGKPSGFRNNIGRIFLKFNQPYRITGFAGALSQHEIEIVSISINLLTEVIEAGTYYFISYVAFVGCRDQPQEEWLKTELAKGAIRPNLLFMPELLKRETERLKITTGLNIKAFTDEVEQEGRVGILFWIYPSTPPIPSQVNLIETVRRVDFIGSLDSVTDNELRDASSSIEEGKVHNPKGLDTAIAKINRLSMFRKVTRSDCKVMRSNVYPGTVDIVIRLKLKAPAGSRLDKAK